MSVLQTLVGKTVKALEQRPDCLYLVFDSGETLSIFNEHQCSAAVVRLGGRQLQSVDESVGEAVFVFAEGVRLTVGLDDADYMGPEAMVLSRPGESIVVWN